MSLADRVISAKGGMLDTFGAYTAISSKLERARRFVFSPEAMGACFQLTRSRPSSLLEVQPRCRAPFEITWMEWGGRIPGRSLEDEDPTDRPAHPVFEPERFGVLLECLDDTHQRFGASFLWCFPPTMEGETANLLRKKREDFLNFCPMGVVINWHDDWQPMERFAVLNREPTNLDKDIKPTWPAYKFLGDDREREALMKMDRQVVAAISPYQQRFVDEVRKRSSFAHTEKFIQSSLHDLTGEVNLVKVALCLLNSKNCVDVEDADLSKINNQRRKSRKRPLLSYSIVKISLSKTDQRVASSGAVSRDEIRRHIVRGHFKLRKSGVYWWRPFLRGNPKVGQVIRSGYEVGA